MPDNEQKSSPSFPSKIQNIRKRLHDIQAAFLLARAVSFMAEKQDTVALQIENEMTQALDKLKIPLKSIQELKSKLDKTRQSAPHAHDEDTYIMGGILVYCGIFLQILSGWGIPDRATQIAWISFSIVFPCTIGFFLVRFLNEKNNITQHGWVHVKLAFLAEIGTVVMTAALCFHVWSLVGWLFLFFATVILFGYNIYRCDIYYGPFFSIFKSILKTLKENPPQPVP